MIREFRPGDLPRLKELTIEAFDGVSIDQNIERTFGPLAGTRWQERKSGHVANDVHNNAKGVFVAEEEGQVLGYVTSSIDRATKSGHIINLGVDRRFRGRGLGRALIERALRYFRDNDMHYARIEALEQNRLCMEFYPRLGFTEVARQVQFFRKL